ncbi:hypothetical protein FPY71_05415 [Aureimonas fodinaquatilis]|uniref:Calcium-binding protein n=1 Tax=Aureimonas fodinaquatilis TaxID=2565783 RepID=A0A5B0E122_9HYPH|nr:hypothetical protein [Aureimonas fodinaquatilis]KAA0972523.1 hypothetical protein FPY71_05415 [Aureimonas fodinaquatilis]
MSSTDPVLTTAEILNNIRLAIAEYNKTKAEISGVDEAIRSLLTDFTDKPAFVPDFTLDEVTKAVFKQMQAGNVLNPLAEAGSDAINPPVEEPIGQVGWDHRKTYDNVYNSVWRNARLVSPRSKLALSYELMDFKRRMNAGMAPADNNMVFSKNLNFSYQAGNFAPAGNADNRALEQKNNIYRQNITSVYTIAKFINIVTALSHQEGGGGKETLLLSADFSQILLEGFFAFYANRKGAEATANQLIGGGIGIALVNILQTAAYALQFHENKESGASGLILARDALLATENALEAMRGVAMSLSAAGVEGLSGVSGAIGGLAALAGLTSDAMQLADAAQNEGASGGYIAAGAATMITQLAGSLMVSMAAGPWGAAIGAMVSSFDFRSLQQSVEMGELSDQYYQRASDSGWLGYKAIGDVLKVNELTLISAGIPGLNLLPGIFGSLFGPKSSDLQNEIWEKYGTGENTKESLATAYGLFWNAGYDDNFKAVQGKYIDLVKTMAATTEVKRVVAITRQEVTAEMLVIGAYLGNAAIENMKSSSNVSVDSLGVTSRLNSDEIDITTSAESQYVFIDSPIMPVSDEERKQIKQGKKSSYSTSLPTTPIKFVDKGETSSIIDVRNVATTRANIITPQQYSTASKVSGSAGGVVVKAGNGNDQVIFGLTAGEMDGGEGIDGAVYQHAISSAAKVNVFNTDTTRWEEVIAGGITVVATPNTAKTGSDYEVSKIGYGDIHEIVLKETVIEEGKKTTTIQTRSIVTHKNVFSGVNADLLKNVEWIAGSNVNDKFVGDALAQTFYLNGGRDVAEGLGGDDTIHGGDDNDTVDGGEGYDLTLGGAGDDVLRDTGTDTGPKPTGDANVAPTKLGDTLIGGDGLDTIYAGAGDDLVFGDTPPGMEDASAAGAKVAYKDFLYGEAGKDTIDGGAGNDVISGGDGDDHLFGGLGNDTISGDAGRDLIWGGEGNDSLIGGADGGALYGQEGDDILTASNVGTLLMGGSGKNTLRGGNGHDTIIGGADSDIIQAGDGNDLIFNEGAAAKVQNQVFGGGGNDIYVMVDKTLFDLFDGGAGIDWVSAQFLTKGVDINLERRTADWAGGAAPSKDSLRSVERAIGSEFNDILTGSSTDNYLIGRGGNDSLNGGNGKDILFGGAGRDELRGGAGADLLDGGAGDDYLYALGGDTFFFDGDFGHDLVLAEEGGNMARALLIFTGIDYRNLYFVREDNHLLVRREQVILDTDKSQFMGQSGVMVMDFFKEENYNGFAIADQSGRALVGVQVETLTNAMAAATDVSSPGYAQFMQPIWNAAWTITAPA